MITTILLCICCRKELDYSPITCNIEIDIDTIDYNLLWGESWQTKLLFEWDTTIYGKLYHTPNNRVMIAISNVSGNKVHYSYDILGKIGENIITTSSGMHLFTCYSIDNEQSQFTIQNNSVVSTTPSQFYYATLNNIEIHQDYDRLIFNNNRWEQQLKCTLQNVASEYIVQVITHSKKLEPHLINEIYIGGVHMNFDITNGSVIGDTTTIQSQSIFAITDSLYMGQFTIYNQDIERLKNQCSYLYANYSDNLHYNSLIPIRIDSALRENPNGGVITLKLNIDSLQDNNVTDTLPGCGMDVKLEDWLFDKIEIYL